jgi:hypothetical protein
MECARPESEQQGESIALEKMLGISEQPWFAKREALRMQA